MRSARRDASFLTSMSWDLFAARSAPTGDFGFTWRMRPNRHVRLEHLSSSVTAGGNRSENRSCLYGNTLVFVSTERPAIFSIHNDLPYQEAEKQCCDLRVFSARPINRLANRAVQSAPGIQLEVSTSRSLNLALTQSWIRAKAPGSMRSSSARQRS